MALAILIAAFSAQEIDFKTVVARVPVVVQQLSKATGTKLGVATSLTDEVVCVLAEHKSGNEIMEQLAYALDASWVKHGDSYTLDRPANWPSIARDRRAAVAKKAIEASLRYFPPAKEMSPEDLAEEASKVRKAREDTQEMNMEQMMIFGAKTPVGALLDTMIATITPAGLARNVDRRTVFSNRPNQMQVALPAQLDRAIAEFADKHNRAVIAIEPTMKSKFNWGADNPLDNWSPVDASTLKALLIVDSTADLNAITLRIFQDGKLAAATFRFLNEPNGSYKAPPVKLIPISEHSFAFMAKQNSVAGEQVTLTDPALISEYSKPLDHEILEPGNTEAMQAIHAREQKPLVAVIPDEMIARRWLADDKGDMQLGLYEALMKFAKVTATDHGRWLIFRPEAPGPRLSRAGLTRTIDQGRRDGRMTLDNWATSLLRAPDSNGRLLSEYTALLGLSPRREWIQIPNVIRFYGLTTKEQRAALQQGKALMADDLDRPQKAAVMAAIFGEDNFTTIIKKSSPQAKLSYERTELFARGFANPQSVTAEFSGGDAYYMLRKGDGREWTNRVEANSLAWQAIQIDRPDLVPSQGEAIQLKSARFVKGQEMRYELVFAGNESIDLGTQVGDEVIDKSKSFGWNELPAKLRDDFEAAKKALIERYEKLKKDGRLNNTGKSPPPRSTRS